MATQASPLVASRNRRVVLIVAVAAVVAAGAVVGATLLQTRGERTGYVARAGRPPLELDFGVAAGTQARTLARAQQLYEQGDAAAAQPLFTRYDSPAAQVGAAFASWQDGRGVATLERLAGRYPRSALVALHLGWAYYWAGRNAQAVAAWEKAARTGRDSPYGVDAEDVLHPNLTIPGLPPIVLPNALAKLAIGHKLAALRRAAAGPDAQAKLVYGVTLWNLKRPVSAEQELAAAAKLAPHDPLTRAAAAVALFSKANPVRAFAHLGPLTAVFPRSPALEFHLGVLLLYINEDVKAAQHLRAAVADGPRSPYAKPAGTLLASLARTRSK